MFADFNPEQLDERGRINARIRSLQDSIDHFTRQLPGLRAAQDRAIAIGSFVESPMADLAATLRVIEGNRQDLAIAQQELADLLAGPTPQPIAIVTFRVVDADGNFVTFTQSQEAARALGFPDSQIIPVFDSDEPSPALPVSSLPSGIIPPAIPKFKVGDTVRFLDESVSFRPWMVYNVQGVTGAQQDYVVDLAGFEEEEGFRDNVHEDLLRLSSFGETFSRDFAKLTDSIRTDICETRKEIVTIPVVTVQLVEPILDDIKKSILGIEIPDFNSLFSLIPDWASFLSNPLDFIFSRGDEETISGDVNARIE